MRLVRHWLEVSHAHPVGRQSPRLGLDEVLQRRRLRHSLRVAERNPPLTVAVFFPQKNLPTRACGRRVYCWAYIAGKGWAPGAHARGMGGDGGNFRTGNDEEYVPRGCCLVDDNSNMQALQHAAEREVGVHGVSLKLRHATISHNRVPCCRSSVPQHVCAVEYLRNPRGRIRVLHLGLSELNHVQQFSDLHFRSPREFYLCNPPASQSRKVAHTPQRQPLLVQPLGFPPHRGFLALPQRSSRNL